ncbi:MAG: HD domain-containing protein [Candidatus Omnitrophica bacterium]|nr:HD domain-containing protein [Candidatus Omnitrophota bacterium]
MRGKLNSFERSILTNPSWKKGYRSFNRLMGRPLGWLFFPKEGGDVLLRLDRKTQNPWYAQSASHEKTCENYLCDYARSRAQQPAGSHREFICHEGKRCVFFSVRVFGDRPACYVACDLKAGAVRPETLAAFQEFLQTQFDLAVKAYELKNLSETLHPRSKALSTIHSVHRVVNTAFNVDELLPRIGRLLMQVLKTRECSIALVDKARKRLVPKFSSAGRSRLKKIGSGIEGRVALNGEIHFSRKALAVPFIDQDVIGVIMTREKSDDTPFTNVDLEILQMISEQTVVAIRNAQLYAEMQELTLGSIRSITELLELSFAGDQKHMPLFCQLVRDLGLALGLSRRELIDLERAALLLNTGYVGLPKKILGKKSALTPEEFDRIKQHPFRGAQVLRSIHSFKSLIPIILHHHERFDGKGYPRGLAGEAIPLGARIMAVADSFTAMISKRPYRKAKSAAEAVEEIKRNAASQFDPRVVENFIKIMKDRKI